MNPYRMGQAMVQYAVLTAFVLVMVTVWGVWIARCERQALRQFDQAMSIQFHAN